VEKDSKSGKDVESIRRYAPILTWGWQFLLTLLVFVWGGHWLDQKWGTGVTFVLIGIFMGLFGGFYKLIRIVKDMSKSTK
jgi:hypothetical protein